MTLYSNESEKGKYILSDTLTISEKMLGIYVVVKLTDLIAANARWLRVKVQLRRSSDTAFSH